MIDQLFARLDAAATRRIFKLDLHHMASGTGGHTMLDMLHSMHRATDVFPWRIVVKDGIRRDMQTRAAREVHIQLDSTADYGLALSCPCRGFASRSVWGAGTDDEVQSPASTAQGNGWFVRREKRPADEPARRAASPSRCGSLSPVRETGVASAPGGHERSQL